MGCGLSHKGSMSRIMLILDASWLKSQRGGPVRQLRHHHVVSLNDSLVVIVMCPMLKCMETSKVEIQAHTLAWSVSFQVFLVILVMFTLCGAFRHSF